MQDLLASIKDLKKGGVKRLVDKRIREFKSFRSKPADELFKELCFCLLTANYSAEGGMRIQEEVGDGFCYLSEPEMREKLKDLGHRFPNTRADFIVEGRKHKDNLKERLISFEDERKLREWLVKNVKGLGYKESSHFLRNIGFDGLAIIDFHIVDALSKHGLIKKPKVMTKRKYLETENLLKEIADKAGLTLAELDLYLWYMETGKVLK